MRKNQENWQKWVETCETLGKITKKGENWG